MVPPPLIVNELEAANVRPGGAVVTAPVAVNEPVRVPTSVDAPENVTGGTAPAVRAEPLIITVAPDTVSEPAPDAVNTTVDAAL